MSENISNPDPESLDPDADRAAAEAAGYLGLSAGMAPWAADSTYSRQVRLHGIVRRVSHHARQFDRRKRPPQETTLAVEIPALAQTVIVTLPAVQAVAFAAPGQPVTIDAWPSGGVSPGHLPPDED